MNLNSEGLKNRSFWETAGYQLPLFDHEAVSHKTKEAPFWIHFGAGNIFRAFQANAVQKLLNDKILDRGLVVAEGYDYEIIEKMYHPHDNYSILATLKADGSIEKTVVGSIAESLTLDSHDTASYNRSKEIFGNESLQLASFTITEKGYSLNDSQGLLLPDVLTDFTGGPKIPVSYMGKVSALLYHRFTKGGLPIAMVSMDNCSQNGDKLKTAITAFAEKWVENNLVEPEFLTYVTSNKVSFPWTMIDKITPRPNTSVEELLKKDGVQDLDPVITGKHTYVAPFVNSEECEYLVIEDTFPNGRPALEKSGFIFTDRETVDKVERMKVCTCLNPLHTALAVFGCLLDYKLIAEEMKDSTLKTLVERLGYQEGLPVVTDPGILNPKEFLDTVLGIRIPNPFMPDTPQRIATDTSQKLSIRYGETIKAYEKSSTLQTSDLKMIPLVFAGWLRYLTGKNDRLEDFPVSPDPMADILGSVVSSVKLDGTCSVEHAESLLHPVLENEKIWGVNLYDAGLAPSVCHYFIEMPKGAGAVRSTLEKYV
ncbi:mannitol dehydrogenase family protein [Ruminococcus sp. OM08-9BH]|nr:mannitol dehydrogenase family protein [Ruminococcus sp. OM08-9BH]